MRRPHRFAAAVLGLALLAACGDSGSPTVEGAGTGAQELVGTLAITAGACADDAPAGSYFKMIQPGGNPTDGPFVDNVDSSCPDTTITLLTPGTDGGLRTGAYQPPLGGDLSALSVSWNGQHFNQGAPKPGADAVADGVGAVSGTYDAASGAYTLDWSSLIEGGPFDGFTGVWHLEGTFTAS